MPVSTVATSFTYKPAGAMLPEAVPFQFFAGNDLAVTHIDTAGVRTELTDAAFVVAGSGLVRAGTIRATGAWPADDLFLVERRTERVQKADIKPHEPVPAVGVTQQLDRTMFAVQEQDSANADTASRALMMPPGEGARDLPVAGTRASSALVFDEDGEPTTKPIGSFPVGPPGGSDSAFDTLGALKASNPVDHPLPRLNTLSGVVNYAYATGNFTGKADDLFVVELNDTPITTGALILQGAQSITTTLTGAYFRSQQDANADQVWAEDFGAIGDGSSHPVSEWIGASKRFLNLSALQSVYPHVTAVTDEIDWAAIQGAVDFIGIPRPGQSSPVGGTVQIGRKIYYINRQVALRNGVSLNGSAAHYEYKNDVVGNVFMGSWFRARGLGAGDAAMLLKSVNNCNVRQIGLDLGEVPGSVGIALGSDNNPACKEHRFQDIAVFGAGYAVQWGFGNALTPLEQVDAITFDGFTFNSCKNGFLINAENAADYSQIKRGSMLQMSGVGFELINAGFMKIEDVAMGGLDAATSIMFRITGTSPDPLRISGCQIEPVGRFMTASGPNDARIIILQGNVINLPIELSGTLRVHSFANNITSYVSITGYVRWRSTDDTLSAGPGFEQIRIGEGGGQFVGSSFKDASSFNGAYLPLNYKFENANPVSGGPVETVVTRKGIVVRPFADGVFYPGYYVGPTANNGHAYLVTAGDTPAGEPVFPPGAGATVTSGNVTFQEVGPSAIVEPLGIVGAKRAGGLTSASTAADVVAALQAAGLAA